MEKNLTQGSVFKTVVSFSLPYFFAYFLQTLYGLADLFIIGRFCTVDATTAVSGGSQVMHMLTVMIVGLAMGSTVTIARSVGAGDRDRACRAVGNTAVLFLLVAAAATAVLTVLVRYVVSLLSTPEAAAEGAEEYLRICFLGIPFITAYNILSSVFRGLGDSKSPMYFVAAACVFNIALDYLFIGALGMGPAGAALGTTLSQAASVVLSLAVIVRRRMLPGLRREHFRPEHAVMGDILKIGVPVAAQDGFIQVAFVSITVFANLRGLTDAAAVGVVEKIIGILFLVPSSMLSAVSAIAAQNIGAGRPDRARETLRYAVMISVSFGLVTAAVMQFAAGWAVGLFTQDGEVIRLGAQYMRSYVFDCVFAGFHFCFSGYFCACGRSGVSFIHNCASIVTARIPLAYIASRRYASLFPMGLAAPIGSAVSTAICLAVYARMRKKEG